MSWRPTGGTGIVAIPKNLKIGELVGIYTLKGEIVGLAEAAMTKDEIEHNVNGLAFYMKRIIMKPSTYPKVGVQVKKQLLCDPIVTLNSILIN